MLSKRPWLLIVGLFIVLIAAWTVLVYIAETNKPEMVPLETAGGAESEQSGMNQRGGTPGLVK